LLHVFTVCHQPRLPVVMVVVVQYLIEQIGTAQPFQRIIVVIMLVDDIAVTAPVVAGGMVTPVVFVAAPLVAIPIAPVVAAAIVVVAPVGIIAPVAVGERGGGQYQHEGNEGGGNHGFHGGPSFGGCSLTTTMGLATG